MRPDGVRVVRTGFALAESPSWHPLLHLLAWIDIPAGVLWMLDGGGGTRSFTFEQPIGAAVPATDGWLIAAGEHIVHAPVDGRRSIYAVVEHSGRRFNDGGCDPAGRALFGTMDLGFTAPTGTLTSWSRGTGRVLASGLPIPNGVGWSPDGTLIYLSDTVGRAIRCAAYDVETGMAGGWTTWDLSHLPGKPDGLCVDRDGALWVALWNGRAVVQLDPEGEVVRLVEVDAGFVSSCCFGGPMLDVLYVTTAESKPGRMDGAVLALDVGAQGSDPSVWDPAS